MRAAFFLMTHKEIDAQEIEKKAIAEWENVDLLESNSHLTQFHKSKSQKLLKVFHNFTTIDLNVDHM